MTTPLLIRHARTAVLAACLAAVALAAPGPARAVGPEPAGLEAAHEFVLEDINPGSESSGKKLALSDLYQGGGVVLKFIASWCTFCRDELPEVEKLARSGQAPIVYVAADEYGHRESIQIIAERNELSRPVLFVPEADVEAFEEHWDHQILPATYVIDSKGRVRQVLEGVHPTTELLEAVARSLGE